MWTSNSLNQIPGSAVSFKPWWAAPMRCAMCLALTLRGTHVQLYQDKPSASHTTLHACCHCKSPSSVTILCSMIIATRFCKSIKTHIVSSLYTNSTEMPCHFFFQQFSPSSYIFVSLYLNVHIVAVKPGSSSDSHILKSHLSLSNLVCNGYLYLLFFYFPSHEPPWNWHLKLIVR